MNWFIFHMDFMTVSNRIQAKAFSPTLQKFQHSQSFPTPQPPNVEFLSLPLLSFLYITIQNV